MEQGETGRATHLYCSSFLLITIEEENNSHSQNLHTVVLHQIVAVAFSKQSQGTCFNLLYQTDRKKHILKVYIFPQKLKKNFKQGFRAI